MPSWEQAPLVNEKPWEQAPLVGEEPSWIQAPLVAESSMPHYGAYGVAGFGPGQERLRIEEAAKRAVASLEPEPQTKDSAIARVGKGLWNSVIAMPAFVFKTETPTGEMGQISETMKFDEKDFQRRAFSGEPVTQGEVDWYAAPTNKEGKPIERPFWAEAVWLNYQSGRLNVQERTKKEELDKLSVSLKQGKLSWAKKSDIFATISKAEGFKDHATDVLTGVTGFVARLALLKKAFPGVHPAVLWELENEVTGGTPGKGALMYGAFNVPGKLIKGVTTAAKVERTVAESAALGGLTAIESKLETGEVAWKDVAISAGIPWALKTPGLIKSRLKAKDPKFVQAARDVAAAPVQVPTVEGAVTNLKEWSRTAKLIRKEQWEPEVKKLHKRQAKMGGKAEVAALKKGATAEEALRSIKSGFKGKAPRPEIDPPRLTPQQWNALSERVQRVYAKSPFDKSRLQEVLDNLRYRRIIPDPSDFAKLEPILGSEATIKIYEQLARKHHFSKWDGLRLLRDGLKSKFGYDPQARRQFAALRARHPLIRAESTIANLKGIFSEKESLRIAKTIETRPSFTRAVERGINFLGMRPWETKGVKKLQQYGDFTEWLLMRKSKIARGWGRALHAVERGSNVGINLGLLKQFEVAEKYITKLAAKRGWGQKEIDAFWKQRTKDINTFSKRVVAKHPSAKKIQEAAKWWLFSPAYTVSRPLSTVRAIKNLFKGGPGNKTYAAGIVLSNIAAIHLMDVMVNYASNKMRAQDPTKEPLISGASDPTDALSGKIRIGKDVIDLTGGEASWYRLIARLGVSAYAYGKEKVTGDVVTRVGRIPARSPGEEIKRYLQSRETILLGLGKAILTGKDWLGRPLPPKDLILQQIPMEPLQAIVDAGIADGMWEELAEGKYGEVGKDLVSNVPLAALGFMGYGISSYPVPAINTRASFRDIVAQDKYNKDWVDLTPKEQRKLNFRHRKNLEKLDKQVAIERIDRPYNIDRIKEEEREMGERIRSQLSESNQLKVEGVSLGLSRRPEKFFLNDTRYNRYESLVIENLNEHLNKFKKPSEKAVEAIVRQAKKRAWVQLQREL